MPEYLVKQFVISIDRNYDDSVIDACDGIPAIEGLQDFYISDIERIYEDGSDRVYIDWYSPVLYVKEDGGEVYDPQYQNHNEYQRSKVNKHGDLFIEVGATAELDSIFPDDVINADVYTVFERQGGK